MWDLAQQFKKAFPSYLEEEVNFILKNTNAKQLPVGYSVKTFPVLVGNEIIEIPVRHTLTEMRSCRFLARVFNKNIVIKEIQQNIVDCFYMRHCDGLIREDRLKKIIHLNHEWIVPYVFELIGEYVIEILDVIYDNLGSLDLLLYKEFIEKNPKFYKLTQDRVQSYWNAYYRGHNLLDLYHSKYGSTDKLKYVKEEYVGFKILDFFDK